MRKMLNSVFFGVMLAAVAACSNSSPTDGTGAVAGAEGVLSAPGGNSGASIAASGGTVSGMGGSLSADSVEGDVSVNVAGSAPSAGGSTTAMGGTGGAGGASVAAAGGAPSAGASTTAMGGTGGASVAAAGGAPQGSLGGAGMTSNAGAGGESNQAVSSVGCGNMNPATGSRSIMTGAQMATFNVKLPDDYDATTPVPLGFGFHGFGNGACGPDQGECRGFADLPAVTVYMKSISDGWEQSEVLEENITFFQDVLALMKNEYCIDESRIFVAGVSSGGQFVEHLTCRFGDTLWQVTPVSASVVRAADMDCVGTPPVLVIHGVTDEAGNYGEDVAALFAQRNGCSETPPAGLDQAKTDMMAAFNATRDEHICLDWDACSENPVRFCLSSQITYSGLTHGWPQVGGTLISEFHATLE